MPSTIRSTVVLKAAARPFVKLAAGLGLAVTCGLGACDGCSQPTCETVACGDELICRGDICVQDVDRVTPPADVADGATGDNTAGGGTASGGGGTAGGGTAGGGTASGDAPDEGDTPGDGGGTPGGGQDTGGQGGAQDAGDATGGGPQEPPEEELTAGGCPVSSVSPEACSFEDEDCDGENNEGLDCTFIASSDTALWTVDPFTGEVNPLVDVDLPGIEVIFDIDTDMDGSVLATGGRSLYRIADDGSYTTLVAGGLPFNPNGLAVGRDGRIFIANHDSLVGSRVVTAASSDEVPTLLERLDPWNSSGDCVSHKSELYITTAGENGDELVVMNTVSGEVSSVGAMGVANIWGLSSAFGLLFGVTSGGQIVEIDDQTGAATVLASDTGVAFTGAANRR